MCINSLWCSSICNTQLIIDYFTPGILFILFTMLITMDYNQFNDTLYVNSDLYFNQLNYQLYCMTKNIFKKHFFHQQNDQLYYITKNFFKKHFITNKMPSNCMLHVHTFSHILYVRYTWFVMHQNWVFHCDFWWR